MATVYLARDVKHKWAELAATNSLDLDPPRCYDLP